MKILALGGCGQQGSCTVKTLIAADDVEKVIVADINGGGPVVRMKSLQGDINIRKD